MTPTTGLDERQALDELEPRWQARGYTVVRQPSDDQLPDFLAGLEPDAIAVGATPSLIIEVLGPGSRSSRAKVRRIQELLEGQPDWRLEVVYRSADGARIEPVAEQDIRVTLRTVDSLVEAAPGAALLMAWATLEAAARRLEPALASKGLPSASLVDLLVGNGHLPQAEASRLRRLGELRNAIAHGQIDTSPAAADVRHVLELSGALAS